MYYRKVLTILTAVFLCTTLCKAQYNKLGREEAISAELQASWDRLGRNIDGDIDSVWIISHTEKVLNLRIFYTGFLNSHFTVSTLRESKTDEPLITTFQFSQESTSSPVDCALMLNGKMTGNSSFKTPYLKIVISPLKSGRIGEVRVFGLNKLWETTTDPANSVVVISLKPVGVAAELTDKEVDKSPPKMIFFDPKIKYEIRDRKGTMQPKTRLGTGNAYETGFYIPDFDHVADINGTWTNKNPNAVHKSLTITNGNYLRLYIAGTNGGLTENAHGSLEMKAANRYNSILSPRIPNATIKLSMVLVFNGDNVSVKYYVNSTKPGVVGTIYTYEFYRKPLGHVITIVDPILVTQIDPVTPVSTVAQGPDKNNPQNLWDGIAVDNDVDFGRPQEISNINMTVYRDKNIHSGMWYILPADYHLLWDPTVTARNGYGLYISYGTQPDGSTAADASVLVKAVLTTGINSKEKFLVRSLLKAKDPEFKDIAYLPLESIVSSFKEILGAQYTIPAEKISVTSSSDLENTITVAWSTSPDTKEFIQTALTSGEGIVASMKLKPREADIVEHNIDAIISLSNTRTLGKMELEPMTWRTNKWTNQTAYTLKLKYLHVMKKSKLDNKPIIYSWSIDNIDVPSGSKVSFDDGRVPRWLDNDPSSVMWLSYSVNECDSCNADLITDLTGGVSGNTVQQLRFVIADKVFDTLKATYFIVKVRSMQADPKGAATIELPELMVTKEPGKNFQVGPLFIPKNGAPDFEYNIIAAGADGEFYRTDKWIRFNEKTVYLGISDLKEIFKGKIPGID